MKLLLTDSGIRNESIRDALVRLVGKPLREANALFVPTAIYGVPGGNEYAWQGMVDLSREGWQSFGVLELTAMQSATEENWLASLENADVLLVGGGNTGYLSYWLFESGLAERLPGLLRNTVYVGISAGSLVMTQALRVDQEVLMRTGRYYDDEYDEMAPPDAGSDRTLKLVDFVMRPHVNSSYFPNITFERMQQSAAQYDVPMYVTDEQTAIEVVDGEVRVISEGVWKVFGTQA
jgi:dipeptidase E